VADCVLVTQLFSDGLNHLETTLHDRDKDDEKHKRGMNKKGDKKGIPLSESPFNYAVSYWLKHAMEVRHGIEGTPLSRGLWELVRDFFWDQDGEFFTEWVRVFASGEEDWHESPDMFDSGTLCKPLHKYLSKSLATSVNIAASYGLVDIIEWAHPDGVDFDVPDKIRYTPLIWATDFGQVDVIKMLLSKHSVRINKTACLTPTTGQCSDEKCEGDGNTALTKAAQLVDLGAMKWLLGQPDIEVDLVSHGNTALGWAIDVKHMEAIKLLVGAGAKLAMFGGEVLEIPS
jgi:hypothetical protein